MVKISRSRAAAAGTGFLILAMLLATGAARASDTDPLGRLFTTPRQRAQIDEVRNAEPAEQEIKLTGTELAGTRMPEKQAEEVRDPIMLKGIVSRKGGPSTAWINDGNTYLGDPVLDYIQVTPSPAVPGEVTVRLPTRDAAVDLKVGETYEPATNRIIDPVPATAIGP